MAGKIDLEELSKWGDVSISPAESPEEQAVRLRAEARAALLQHIKEMVTFSAVFLLLTGVTAVCIYSILFDKMASAETQKWAQTALTVLVSGSVSFLFGRALGK